MHSNNIAHLDLKNGNLLLGIDLRLKIIDFDLASHLDDPCVVSNGSVDYRAPELKISDNLNL